MIHRRGRIVPFAFYKIKHWIIAASSGDYAAMNHLRTGFTKGHASRESIDSTLEAYNSSSAEMRSKARDACIRMNIR